MKAPAFQVDNEVVSHEDVSGYAIEYRDDADRWTFIGEAPTGRSATLPPAHVDNNSIEVWIAYANYLNVMDYDRTADDMKAQWTPRFRAITRTVKTVTVKGIWQ